MKGEEQNNSNPNWTKEVKMKDKAKTIVDLEFIVGHMIVRDDPKESIRIMERVKQEYSENDLEAVEDILTDPETPPAVSAIGARIFGWA